MSMHGVRALRRGTQNHESGAVVPEATCLLKSTSAEHSLVLGVKDLEEGLSGAEKRPESFSQRCLNGDDESDTLLHEHSLNTHSRHSSVWKTIPSFGRLVFGRRLSNRRLPGESARAAQIRKRSPSALRITLRLILFLLMLLGLLHSIALLCGLYLAFFPDDFPWPEELVGGADDLGHWPTVITAGIREVACASHNDYWRKEPLFSALKVGCTGVEADVYLLEGKEELYVGHTEESLTPNRTLRSLYLNPILDLLNKHNPSPISHTSPDEPRNGVFEKKPKQDLVLLIDFKNDGEAIWPYVSEQLQPLRDGRYLTYFNGTEVVQGPITVVVTGNAPFRKVVENAHYRDMFFDAPLDIMANMPGAGQPGSADASVTELSFLQHADDTSSQGGQGRSGGAPLNPFIYSPANSFYASVSFKSSILHFPFPLRRQLSKSQLDLIRTQIRGAHARGLKVRYWSVPEWPKSLRFYLWRVLVQEGVDYLNVDDLESATKGDWNWEQGKRGWWLYSYWGR